MYLIMSHIPYTINTYTTQLRCYIIDKLNLQTRYLGVIQELRGQNFAIFWTLLCGQFLYPEREQKQTFFDPLPPHLVHVGIEWPLCSMYLFPIELLANFTVILHKKGIQSGVTLSLLVELPKNCIVKACIPNIFLFGIFIQVNWLGKLASQIVFSIEFLTECAMILHEKASNQVWPWDSSLNFKNCKIHKKFNWKYNRNKGFQIEFITNSIMILHKKGIQSGLTLRQLVEL